MISGAKVDAATATGDTALTYACENGHTAVAEVLLDYGAELVLFDFSLHFSNVVLVTLSNFSFPPLFCIQRCVLQVFSCHFDDLPHVDYLVK